MISIFQDQSELVDDVRAAMRKSKSVLMVSATGSGKTRMAMHMIEAAKNKESRTVFTVPRKGLLEQTSEEFKKHGIAHSFIAAAKPFNPYSQVYIGMVDTMARRLERLPDIKLLIPDETHHGAKSLDAVINHYKQRGSWILGLSATPHKTSGKGLGCWYDTMVEGKSIRWLMDNKRLSDYRLFYGRSKIDLSKIKVTAGDYAKGEIAEYMEHQGVIIGDCVRDYRSRCMGRIHIVRCASIKHSEITAQKFRDDGIPAMHVDGTMAISELRKIFRAWAMREIFVVCFCDLIGMGFDLSMMAGMDVCIESGSDTSPSKSLSKQMQFWGRLFRYKLDPAVINDHVNNYLEHGYPDDDRIWSLEDQIKNSKEVGERASAIFQCPACFFVQKPSLVCSNCGKEREIQSREIEEMDGELVELDRTAARQQAKIQQGQARTLDQLIELGRQRGYSRPEFWAARVISGRNAR